MADAIVDGRGSGNYAGIDETNRLMVVGSITDMPAITSTAGSEQWIQNTVEVSGAKLDDLIGSFYLTNPGDIGTTGSREVYTDTGSVEVYGSLTSVAGSEQWIMNTVEISGANEIGSVVISSAPVLGVSGGIFTDGDMTGSVNIATDLASIGSWTGYTGSIWSMPSVGGYAGSENYIIAGSVRIVSQSSLDRTVSNRVAGSIVNLPAIVGVSGDYFQDMVGSVRAQAVQITDPWITLGSVQVNAGSVAVTNLVDPGSVYITNFDSIGGGGSESWIQNPVGISGTNVIGSVVVMSAPVLGVSGAKLDALTGSFYNLETVPTAIINNNPQYQFIIMTSGTATNVTGSAIGSVVMFIGAGSYVSKWTYDLNTLVTVGSYI